MQTKRSLLLCGRSLLFATAAAVFAACSGGTNSSSPLPPQQSTGNDVAGTPITTLSTTLSSTPSYSVVQTAHAGGAYSSTVNVHLAKAPVAGNVLVLFFEQNQTAAFPYSGQVSWPTAQTGSNWSYDGGTASTAILHHVVQSGETGSYTLNVGGKGIGHEAFTVAEIAGASTTNPLNARAAHTVAAGATQFTFGSGVTPTASGTLPVAFFSAHQANHTWNSISSGWTIDNRNSDYTQMLAAGPVQSGTTTLNATAVLSSASAYAGAADVVLLNPSGTSTVTSTPGPTGGSTPVPTPAPTTAPTTAPVASSSGYSYDGCPVYTANDWFTTNLLTGGSAYASNKVDSNSANIIANFTTAFPSNAFNINGSSATVANSFIVNGATSSTSQVKVQGTTMTNDPYNDDSTDVIPWQSNFLEQGSCSGDCHSVVLNTQTCVDYETYRYGQYSWNGSTYTASTGYVHNLKQPFNNQYSRDAGTFTKAGIPAIGTVDFGEDASLPSINHIAAIILPGSDSSSKAVGGYVAPAADGSGCASYCTNKLPFGARLRLNSSKYTCPNAASYPQAHKICVQLETYGAIVIDHNGTSSSYGIGLSRTKSGANPWNQTDVSQLDGIPMKDWDVMTLGTIH